MSGATIEYYKVLSRGSPTMGDYRLPSLLDLLPPCPLRLLPSESFLPSVLALSPRSLTLLGIDSAPGCLCPPLPLHRPSGRSRPPPPPPAPGPPPPPPPRPW